MQVLNPGNGPKAVDNQLIYFRYMRTNIQDMYDGLNPQPSGNANSVGNSNSTSFRFGNTSLPSTIQWGSGIQVPLRFLSIDCEVNLVVRSYYGVQGETGQCIPYLYNIRYFNAAF